MKLWALQLQADNREISPFIRNIALSDDSNVSIGRAGNKINTLQINQPHISRQHCVIFVKDFNLYIRSTDFTFPTFKNNERLPYGTDIKVHHRDIVTLGLQKSNSAGRNYEYVVLNTEQQAVIKEETLSDSLNDYQPTSQYVPHENFVITKSEFNAEIFDEYVNSPAEYDNKIDIEEHPVPQYDEEALIPEFKVENPYIYNPDRTFQYKTLTNLSYLNHQELNSYDHISNGKSNTNNPENLIPNEIQTSLSSVKQEFSSKSNHTFKLRIQNEIQSNATSVKQEFTSQLNNSTENFNPGSSIQNEIQSNSALIKEELHSSESNSTVEITTNSLAYEIRNTIKRELEITENSEQEKSKKRENKRRKRYQEREYGRKDETQNKNGANHRERKNSLKRRHSSETKTPTTKKVVVVPKAEKREQIFVQKTQNQNSNKMTVKKEKIKNTNNENPRRNSNYEHTLTSDAESISSIESSSFQSSSNMQTEDNRSFTPFLKIIKYPAEVLSKKLKIPRRDSRNSSTESEIKSENEVEIPKSTPILKDPRRPREKCQTVTSGSLATVPSQGDNEKDIINLLGESEEIGPSQIRTGPRRRISLLTSSRTGSESDLSEHDSPADDKTGFVAYEPTVAEEKDRVLHTMTHWEVDWLDKATSDPKFTASVWKQQHIHLTDSEFAQHFKENPGKVKSFCKHDRREDTKIRPRSFSRLSYDSFASYNRAMQPPLYIYLFNILHNNYRNNSEHIEAKLVYKKESKGPYNKSRSMVVNLNFELKPEQHVPNEGDFVILHVSKSDMGREKKVTQRYIGYVKQYLYLKSESEKDAHGKMQYITMHHIEVMLKYPDHTIEQLQMVYIQPIRQIGEEFVKIHGLFELTQSPLQELILKPNKRTLTRPSFIQNTKHIDSSLKTMSKMIDSLKSFISISEEQLNIAMSIAKTLCCPESSLNVIEGETGTGKSHILLWIILLLLSDNMQRDPLSFQQRILVCLSSDDALNQFAIKLYEAQKFIFGERKSTFHMVVLETDVKKLDSRVKIFTLDQQADRLPKNKNRYTETINRSRLILVTEETLSNSHIQDACNKVMKIPICILDDAQSKCELHSLQPLVCHTTKIVLAGDLTFPLPIIKSKQATSCGFNTSLLHRISESLNNDIERRTQAEKSSSLALLTPENLDETTYYKLKGQQYRMSTYLCNVTRDTPKLTSSGAVENKTNPLRKSRFVVLEHEFSVNPSTHEDKTTSHVDWVKEEAKIAAKLAFEIEEQLNMHVKEKLRFLIVTSDSEPAYYATMIGRYLKEERKTSNEQNIQGLPRVQRVMTSLEGVNHILGLECDVTLLCVGQSEGSALQDTRNLRLALTRAKQAVIILGNLDYLTQHRDIEEWIAVKQRACLEETYVEIRKETNVKDIVKTYIL